MWTTLALAIVTSLIKSPNKSAAFEKQLLELRDSINALFPGK